MFEDSQDREESEVRFLKCNNCSYITYKRDCLDCWMCGERASLSPVEITESDYEELMYKRRFAAVGSMLDRRLL
jgi:uncharacterized OB-fold protein